MIELRNISYSYSNQVKALDRISLHVSQGDSVALLGANGCGKSTLLKVINGLITADSGAFDFDGTAVNGRKLKDPQFSRRFHKRIGFIFQNSDAQLFCPTVYEEIAFGPQQLGISGDEARKRTEDAMRLLQISTLADRAPYHLSGGEKKRVAIAAAVVLNPDVYVLDEPMNNLDPKTRRFLRQLLIRLNQAGKTLICATHDFENAGDIFRKAAVFSADHRLIRVDDYEKVIRDRAFLEAQNII
ncbi:energy-coupling factor ABC transporter ATP-binding protein [Sporolactobacillus vineae]|uniref:energy-coupling factor ABC transporter ATP-binding protein n=1 Tax=Sporolactobacillus vineae TaxID=444463 RepID=UPI000288D7A1|nr:ABC transporter ATP-binding protein [Sporolactobacillus vineae]